MKITGSIVVYNTDLEELLLVSKCFLSNDKVVRLYIIDNSPDDHVSAHLCFDERIIYRHFPENLGYGRGHNVGMSASLGEATYHVVLNTDISFDADCIDTLFAFMESRPDIGLVVPKVTYPDGTLQHLVRNNPTPYILFARRFFRGSKKAEENFRYYENLDKDYDKPMYHIPFVSGCFMFLRCATLKKSGLFDEKIFMYTEDADLSRRILQVAGTAYWPYALAIHDFKGGVHKSLKLTWHGLRSAFYYFNKWGWSNKLIRMVKQ